MPVSHKPDRDDDNRRHEGKERGEESGFRVHGEVLILRSFDYVRTGFATLAQDEWCCAAYTAGGIVVAEGVELSRCGGYSSHHLAESVMTSCGIDRS